jgi:pimeloyl-ACP methyl ester carboxylesterase
VGRFELFGHSFGGLVSLALAAKEGERINRLTVASAPALGVPLEVRLLLSNPLIDLTLGWTGRFPVWRPALRSYLQLIWGEATPLAEHHLALYEEAVSAPGFSAGMLEALRAVGQFRAPLEALKVARFDKHVLWGEKDRLVSVIQGEQLARALGAELEVLPDVGHCVPEEHPEALAAALLR